MFETPGQPLEINVIGGTYVDIELMVRGVIRGDVSLEVVSRAMALGGPGYCYALQLARLGVSVRLETALGSCQWSQQARLTLRPLGVEVAAVERAGNLDMATVLIDPQGTKLVFNDYQQSEAVECKADIFGMGIPVLIASPTSVPSLVSAIGRAERFGRRPRVLFAPHSRQIRQLDRLSDHDWELLARAVRLCCVNESDFIPELEARLSPSTTLLVTRGARGCSVRQEGHWFHYPALPLMNRVGSSNGAGEAFFAGVVCEWLAGASIERALERGSMNAVMHLRDRHRESPAMTTECV